MLEYLVATDTGCAAAEVYRTEAPPEWSEIPPMMLFKSGLFVRISGGVERLARTIEFDEAVAYAVWDDPALSFVSAGREVRPGVTAAFLVAAASADGPPWIPLQAQIQSSPSELEMGILSPWLDQVACARFRPSLAVQKGKLVVASATGSPVVADHVALRQTLEWLARNPAADSVGARVARTMLVDNGHGLQRMGISLMHASDAERRRALDEILLPLAPDVAALLRPLWEMWDEPAMDAPGGGLGPAALAVADVLARNLQDGAPLQSPAAMAVLTTWLGGLFGVRTERSGRQPARALFALARAVRRAGRRADGLSHVDGPPLPFPLDAAETDSIVRDLSRLPREESDLERLIRALATAECAWHIVRPRRDHLRPFRIAHGLLRGWPNASRTLIGRYDHIFTGWTFRGAELRTDDLEDVALRGVFVTDAASVTTVRGFARTVATPTRAGAFVAAGLQSCDHPALTFVGALRDLGDDEVVRRYEESALQPRVTWLRLQSLVGAAEYLITKLEHQDDLSGFQLHPPVAPGAPNGGARAHFMYWRLFCRSIAWKRSGVYAAFIDASLPGLAALPPKLQSELFALIRRWAPQSDENRQIAARWAGPLAAAASRFVEADDRTWLDGEWVDALAGALAAVSPEAFVEAVDVLLDDPRFDVAHLDRLLDAPRAAGWRREYVEHPQFTRVRSRLTDAHDRAAVWGRVEWTRAACERARGFEAVRWLLDARGYPRVVGSAAFAAWFKERGARAAQDPDAAIVELLEIGLRSIGDAHVDLLVRSLDARTLWPSDQHVQACLEAGRLDAALVRMRVAPPPPALHAATLVAAAEQARRGADLRSVAIGLAHFEELHGATADAERVRRAVTTAFSRYKPSRHALGGFEDAADAWRLARLGTAEPGLRLAAHAAKWVGETQSEPLAELIEHVAGAAVAARVQPAIAAIVAGAGGPHELAAAIVEAARDDGSAAPARLASSGRTQMARRMRAAARLSDVGAEIDAAFAAAVARLSADEGARAADRLAGLTREAVGVSAAERREESEEDAGAAPPDSLSAGTDEAAETAPPRAVNDGDAAERADRLAAAVCSGAARWAGLLRRSGAGGPQTQALILRAARWGSAPMRLRAEVLSLAGGGRGSSTALADPRHLLVSDFLDGAVLRVDPLDVAAIAGALRVAIGRHVSAGVFVVDRDGLVLPLPRRRLTDRAPAAGSDEHEHEHDAPAPLLGETELADVPGDLDVRSTTRDDDDAPLRDDGDPPISDGGDTSAGVAAPGAESEGSEGHTGDPTPPPAASDDRRAATIAEILRLGWAADADPDARTRAFGEPGVPVVLRHLLKRNPALQVTIGTHEKRPAIVLRWRR